VIIGGILMDAFNTVNDVLVGLFRDIILVEENTIITEEFKDITCNDMHIIEAVGIEESKNMSKVAGELMVTVSTLTTSINALVRKGYVEKIKGKEDRREVYLKLTDRGIAAYEHHRDFHVKMTEEVIKHLSEEETKIMVKALTGISDYFRLKD